MININAIEFENIGPFQDKQRFEFNGTGLHLIDGINLDFKDEVDSEVDPKNGIGKSFFATIIRFAFFGYAKDTNKNVLINKAVGKNLRVRIEFSDKEDSYIIERYKKHDKFKDELFFFKNDIEITASNKTQTQQDIIDLIVVTDDTFLKCALFTREDNPQFLALTLSERGKIFENIVHLSKFKKYLENAKAKKKAYLKIFENIIVELKAEQKNNSTLIQMFNSLYRSIKSNRAEIIESIKNDNNSISQELLDKFEKFKNLNTILDSLIDKLNYEEDAYQDILNNNSKLESQISIKETQITSTKNIIKEYEEHSKCENCGHVPKENQNKIEDLNAKIAKLEVEVNALKALIRVNDSTRINTIKTRISQIENKIDELNFSDEDAELIKSNNNSNVDNLRTQLLKTNYNQAKLLIEKIRKSNFDIKQLQANKDDLSKRLIWCDKAIALLDINQEDSIKQHILSEIVPVFNDILQKNVDYIYENQMTISFDNNLNESIVYKSEQYDFKELSTGEKTRLDLCISFSILELTRLYLGGFNVLFLDEVFSNIDEYFIIKFLKLIKEKYQDNTAIYIISHSAGLRENAKFDSIVNLVMENECSTFTVEHF